MAASGENRLPGMVERWVYLGNAVQLIVRLATGETIQVLIQKLGDEIPYSQGTPGECPSAARGAARASGHRRTPPAGEGSVAASALALSSSVTPAGPGMRKPSDIPLAP